MNCIFYIYTVKTLYAIIDSVCMGIRNECIVGYRLSEPNFFQSLRASVYLFGISIAAHRHHIVHYPAALIVIFAHQGRLMTYHKRKYTINYCVTVEKVQNKPYFV